MTTGKAIDRSKAMTATLGIVWSAYAWAVAASPASAQEAGGHTDSTVAADPGGSSIGVTVSATDDEGPVAGGRRHGVGSTAPERYNLSPVLLVNPATGGVCVGIVRTPYNPATELTDEVRTRTLIAQYGPCPGVTLAAKPPPGVTAQQLWQDQVHLPAPDPYIAPGKAIVGKAAYLEINGDHTFTPAPLGAFGDTFTITGAATHYDVFWGDGTTSQSTDPGGPWPDGTIRHAYATDGTYSVRVVEYWHGTYSLNGGAPQAIPGAELRTEHTITLPVEQVQAVGA